MQTTSLRQSATDGHYTRLDFTQAYFNGSYQSIEVVDSSGSKLSEVLNNQAQVVVYYLRKNRETANGKDQHLEELNGTVLGDLDKAIDLNRSKILRCSSLPKVDEITAICEDVLSFKPTIIGTVIDFKVDVSMISLVHSLDGLLNYLVIDLLSGEVKVARL